MIRISILYPNDKGSRFDVSYYVETHMPMSIKLLSAHPGFKGVSVERGIGGAVPGSEPAYVAMCHFSFSSVESFLDAFIFLLHTSWAIFADCLTFPTKVLDTRADIA